MTRAALGAGPLRLVRQFLAESLLLSLAGGAAGVALAFWGVDVLVAVGAAKIPRADEVALDWQAFLFLLSVCVGTAVLFGLAPALLASRADTQSLTRESGGRSTASSRYGYIRDALVVAEVALAFVLAFGAAGVMRGARSARAHGHGDGHRQRAHAAPDAARAGSRLLPRSKSGSRRFPACGPPGSSR